MTEESGYDVEVYTVTARELEAVVDRAVKRAFADIGLHPDTPEERKQIRDDFHYLRRWRQAVDGASIQVGRVVIMAVAGGIVTVLWIGFKLHVLKQP